MEINHCQPIDYYLFQKHCREDIALCRSRDEGICIFLIQASPFVRLDEIISIFDPARSYFSEPHADGYALAVLRGISRENKEEEVGKRVEEIRKLEMNRIPEDGLDYTETCLVSITSPEDMPEDMGDFPSWHHPAIQNMVEILARMQILKKGGWMQAGKKDRLPAPPELSPVDQNPDEFQVVFHALPPLGKKIQLPTRMIIPDAHSILICDHLQSEIYRFSHRGVFQKKYGGKDVLPWPVDFAVDPFGAIFILSPRACKFAKISQSGKKVYAVTMKDTQPATCFMPRHMRIDDEGILWILDTGLSTLYGWNPVTQKKNSIQFDVPAVCFCMGEEGQVWVVNEKNTVIEISRTGEYLSELKLPEDIQKTPENIEFYFPLILFEPVNDRVLYYRIDEERWGTFRMLSAREKKLFPTVMALSGEGELAVIEEGNSTVWMTPFPLMAYLDRG